MKLKFALAAAILGLCAVSPANAADTPVTLRLSYFLPPSHPLQASFQAWAANVTKASGGTVKITIFPAEQLGKMFDHYDMARDGIADIALVGPGYQPGRFPVAGAADLPFLYNDGKKGTAAVDAWYRKYAPDEMKGVRYCLGFIQEPATFFSRGRVVLPTDLKGLKVRPPNAIMGNLVTSFGGTNVSAPPQATRELMERGTVDGTFVSEGSAVLFGIDKVAKYHIDAKTNAWFGVLVINAAKYEALAPAQKQALDSNCTNESAVAVASGWADFEIAGHDKIAAEPGQQTVQLTPEQLEAWRQTAVPLVSAWADSVRKVGVDPNKAMAELRESLVRNGAAY